MISSIQDIDTMHTPLRKLEPLISMSATAALEEMLKSRSASGRGFVRPLVKPSAATAALDAMTNSSPASSALEQMMKASCATSALEGPMTGLSPATAALEESMLLSSSKRVKRSSHDTPRRASMTSFTSSSKFDTTDLFAAIEAPDHKAEFNFPSLDWDLEADDSEEDLEYENFQLNVADIAEIEEANKQKHRRSLSASCILGKRPRGLVRCKTMKSHVDGLVKQQAAFPCVLQAAK